MNVRRARVSAVCAMAALAALVAGCDREHRQFEQPPSASVPIKSLRMSAITPGSSDAAPKVDNPDEQNAYALSEGKRLFTWYNCNGCHSQGGGGMGPALMDDVWIYGSDPANVFASIVQGRPNGMPAWGGRIPESEVWELVAYVRSMSGQANKIASPSRSDQLQTTIPENRVEKAAPKNAATPPAAEHPP